MKPVATEANPAWEQALFEIGFWPAGVVPKDPFPYRYNDSEAGQRHMRTGKQQPECVPCFVTVWPDGSRTEALWDVP